MAKLYKLTDQKHQTYGGCQWGEGVERTAPGGRLCSEGVLHAYTDPLLAVLLNPIHGNFRNPVLWECDGDVCVTDHGLKVGCTRLRTDKIIPLPSVTDTQRTAFGILCAKKVCKDAAWNTWADNWLSGVDRSMAAAAAAEAARAWAAAAAEAAARAAAEAAAAEAGLDIDLAAIARKAMEIE
jgi:hypothetical protein